MKLTPTKPQAINNINEAKESATNQITANKTESLEAIKEAKETDHYQNIDFFEIE